LRRRADAQGFLDLTTLGSALPAIVSLPNLASLWDNHVI